MAADDQYPFHGSGRMGGSENDLIAGVESGYESANFGVARNTSTDQGTPVHTKVFGAKTLLSHRVVDTAGENVGKIQEFMIDVSKGDISYAVLTHGGMLGIGDKLLAIPWPAFTVDPDDERLVVNATKEMLDKAPSFPKDNWPDMTTDEFCSTTYGYYGCELPRP